MLDAGIADLPRLSHVLSQTRHFELLPLSTLQTAQQGVIDELAPEVERLIGRVEAYVERLEVRERGLRARAELQEGRLGDGMRTMGGRSGSAMARARQRSAGGREAKVQQQQVVGAREELKAKQLRQKKERLSYAVERLQMQAQQTERKLRMSMAAQESRRGEMDDEDEDELAG